METWTILFEEDEHGDGAPDPHQRIRPALAGRGSDIAWLPEDGRVDSVPVAGLAIGINSNGFKSLLEVPGKVATLHVTDRRVVVVVPDVAPEPGALMEFANFLTGGAAATLRDAARWTAGRAGIREKFHLVAQVDHLAFAMIRYYKANSWGARSLFTVAAHTGEPAPRVLEFVQTSMSRKLDVAEIAHDVFRRAKYAQLREDLRPLTEAKRRDLSTAGFKPSGDGFAAALPTSIPLTALAAQTGGAECRHRFCKRIAGHTGAHHESASWAGR